MAVPAPSSRVVVSASCPPRRRRAVRVIDADVVIASTWPPSSPCPRRRRAVVPAPSSPRRRLRVAAPSSPRHRPRTVVSAPLLNPHPYPHISPCRRPSSSVLAAICSPRSAILTRSSPSHRCVVVATSSPSRRRVVVAGSSAPSSSRRHVVASSFLPVVAASSPHRRPCLSLPRPRVIVVPESCRECRVAPASSTTSILTFILTSILTSILTLSSPRRRLVVLSSPLSLRRRRVAVELSCPCSAVVAAVFPASSPPRRHVSAPSSFHRAVTGPSRRSLVRLGAPSSSPRRSLVHPGAPSWSCQSSSPPFGASAPPSSPSRHRHPSATVQPSAAPSSPQPSSPLNSVSRRTSRHHHRRRRRRIVAAPRPASPANMQDLVSRHRPSRRRRFHVVVWLWDNICNTALGNIWGNAALG